MSFRGILIVLVLAVLSCQGSFQAQSLPPLFPDATDSADKPHITPLSELQSEDKAPEQFPQKPEAKPVPQASLPAADDKLSTSEFEKTLLKPSAANMTAVDTLSPLRPKSDPAIKPVSLDQPIPAGVSQIRKINVEPENTEPAAQSSMTASVSDQVVNEAPTDTPTIKAMKIKPQIYYTPLSAVAVIPVMKSGVEHAFYDVPALFSRELSIQLETKMPQTHVWSPGYIQQTLKAKGLEHLYREMMKDYQTLGRPNPVALQYLLKQLAPDDQIISRVVFVEADLDTSDPMSFKGFSGVRERIISMANDQRPTRMKYYVRSRIQIYDTLDPNAPRVWLFSWRRSLRADRFENVTPSVFGDTDSAAAFGEASRFLGKEMLTTLPRKVYMEEHVDTSVQGEVVKGDGSVSSTVQSGLQNGIQKLNQGFHNVNLNPMEIFQH